MRVGDRQIKPIYLTGINYVATRIDATPKYHDRRSTSATDWNVGQAIRAQSLRRSSSTMGSIAYQTRNVLWIAATGLRRDSTNYKLFCRNQSECSNRQSRILDCQIAHNAGVERFCWEASSSNSQTVQQLVIATRGGALKWQ